ncbi:4425_t:CDS:2, partial [Acaulospora morrowiae]
LPLGLMENVTYREYEKKVKLQTQLPNCDHEVAHTAFSRQFLSAFTNLQFQECWSDNLSWFGAKIYQTSGHFICAQSLTYPSDVQSVRLPDPEEGYEWMSIASLNSSVMFCKFISINSSNDNILDSAINFVVVQAFKRVKHREGIMLIKPILFNPQNRSTNLGPLMDIKVHIRNVAQPRECLP